MYVAIVNANMATDPATGSQVGQPVDGGQETGFPASGRTDKGGNAATIDIQGEVFQHSPGTIAKREVLHLDQGLGFATCRAGLHGAEGIGVVLSHEPARGDCAGLFCIHSAAIFPRCQLVASFMARRLISSNATISTSAEAWAAASPPGTFIDKSKICIASVRPESSKDSGMRSTYPLVNNKAAVSAIARPIP